MTTNDSSQRCCKNDQQSQSQNFDPATNPEPLKMLNKLNSTQLYCKQARGPSKNKKKKERKNHKKITKNTHKYAQRVSRTYKSLRHFANIGERQKRSQLTKA